ncbi:MAG: DUF4271 domain-containing protein [Bacteroidetes bacterium]|nr:DUF4271 domain-containing protein [Bacteroidota bacterium]
MLFVALIQVGELIARKSIFDNSHLILLFFGFLFLGTARLFDSKIISFSFGTLVNFKTEVSFNDSVKIHPIGSFFLGLNFLFSSSLLFILAMGPIFHLKLTQYLFAFGLATLILLVYLIGIYLVGFITSNFSGYTIGRLHNLNFIHVSGLVALLIDLLWLFNAQWQSKFLIFAIFLFSVLFAIRLIKLTSYAFQEKISWYYLILYLCTLEIFPIYMFSHVFIKFFGA